MIDEPCEHEFNIDCEIVLGDLEMAFDGMRSRVFAQCYKCGLLLDADAIRKILEGAELVEGRIVKSNE